jgi:hypothetical protein
MKSSVELKLDSFFAGDMEEIPTDFSMTMLSKNAQKLISSCDLPAQQKQYLIGLSQELTKAYNNSYSYLFLTGYLVGNFSKINRLINLYHITFRGQGNDFDYLSNMLDMFNPQPVQYPYFKTKKYRHRGKIEEESVLNFPLLFEDTIKTLDAWCSAPLKNRTT